MNGNTPFSHDSRQGFIFHGKGLDYFIISLVNVLLSIITLGIYVPWAMVRSRRYVYENLELNGARFGYHASGGALFLSWFLLMVFYIFIGVVNNFLPLLGSLAFIFLMIASPFLIVKSLQYNALMTTLNNIRFGFHCSMKNAWWIMMGLPVLLIIALGVIIFGIAKIIFNDYDGMIYKIVLLMIVGMVGLSAINGYVYAKWLSLTGKGGSFGIHKFDISVNYQHCIKSCLLSFAILIPFIVVIISLAAPLFNQVTMFSAMGGRDEEIIGAMVLQYRTKIFVCYALYLTGILLSSAYLWLAFRNHFMNGLTLAEGQIRFVSTLNFPGVVLQLVLMMVVSMITFGIAWPWMKMRFIRYQANHSWIEGDLNNIALTDTDEQVDTGFVATVSRGVMPVVPFI